LARQDPVLAFDKCHSDYIRVAKYRDEDTIITTGYDKLIKLWDLRAVKIINT
jgi:WD40 repeat protein